MLQTETHPSALPFQATKALVRAAFICFCGIVSTTLSHAIDSSPMLVRHNISGWSTELRDHQVELITRILDITRPEYGDYSLQLRGGAMTTRRSIFAAETGQLHTGFGTGWGITYGNKENIFLHYRPFLNYLLGCRQFIIRTEDAEQFEKIKSLAELQKLLVGQGTGWPDTQAYMSSNIEVVEAEHFDNLFPMLERKRFDLIPLSVLEIETTYNEIKKKHPNLTILKNIYVFYSNPLSISISKSTPDINDRVLLGLEKLDAENSTLTINQIFQNHFQPKAISLGPDSNTRLFMLDNPNLDPTMDKEIQQHFLKTFVSGN